MVDGGALKRGKRGAKECVWDPDRGKKAVILLQASLVLCLA